MMNWMKFATLSLLPLAMAASGWNSTAVAADLLSGGHPKSLTQSLTPYLLAQREQRTALVIGNGNYDIGRLTNPVNDATDIAVVLRELGFEVIFLKDANLTEIDAAIEQFNDKLRKGGVGLFYFAGHGSQVEGENYLLPIGAKINRKQDLPSSAVPLRRILGAMEDARNPVNLILIDACRDNPYPNWQRSGSKGFAFVEAKGTLISFATGPGKVASDSYGEKSRNSPYTASLLQHMAMPDTRIEEVMKNVRRSVLQKTRSQQMTWESTNLIGDFVFKRVAMPRSIGEPGIEPVQESPLKPPENSPPESSPKAPNASRTVMEGSSDDINLKLRSCKMEGEGARCEFLVTDEARNRRVCIYPIYSRSTGSNLVDSQGTQYKASSVRFGGSKQSSQSVCQQLSRGVSVKALVTFKDVPKQTEPFTLVEVIVREYGQKLLPIRFRDVPIER